MKAEVKLITPQVAAKYLQRNFSNRPLKQKTVLYYADQMKRNLWLLTGQGISISADGALMDGQHRLAAVIKSEKSIKMLVIFGISDNTFIAYDSGKNRSISDVFSIEGITNSATVSVAIAKYKAIEKGAEVSKSQNKLFAKQDYLDAYYLHPEFWQGITQHASRTYQSLRLYSKATIAGVEAFLILNMKHDELRVNSFFDQLVGKKNDEYTCTSKLRELLIKNALTARDLTPRYKFILLIKVWNYFIKGKNIKILKYGNEDHFPKFI